MNGRLPSRLMQIHISATMPKPSRLRIGMGLRRSGSQSARPTAAEPANTAAKLPNWPSG